MKLALKAAIVAGFVALTAAPAAAQVGVYLGPFGAGIGVYPPHYYHHHRICRIDYYGYEHCWWVRDYDY